MPQGSGLKIPRRAKRDNPQTAPRLDVESQVSDRGDLGPRAAGANGQINRYRAPAVKNPVVVEAALGPDHADAMTSVALTPTALSGFFSCRHKTTLSLAVARGTLTRPGQNELERKLLELRGHQHEHDVLRAFEARGLDIHRLPPQPLNDPARRAEAAAETLDSMRRSVAVIHQGVLVDGDWHGRPDFLVREPGQSVFGDYRYSVIDAKLAREAKAHALIQLCVYSEHLGKLQGALPTHFAIIDGTGAQLEFRLEDYLAFYRQAKDAFENFVAGDSGAATYPEPCEHCDVCDWWKHCENRRRADDHLSLVAGLTRKQRERLGKAGIGTLQQLAATPPGAVVPKVEAAQLRKLSQQARLQSQGRAADKLLFEWLIDAEKGSALERLPVPTPGDLFLDLEGDAFVVDGGLDYLFGLLQLGKPEFDFDERSAPGKPEVLQFWATDLAEERAAFERVIDRIALGLQEFPNLHVFHFGHRESDALKRLACRHGTREELVDQLLRQHTLVDLMPIVRQSLRASVENYTLKELEGLYAFVRRIPRRQSSQALQWFGWWLETKLGAEHLSETRATIAEYNADDCLSTWRLRDWLEAGRGEFARTAGRALQRPAAPEDKPKANDGTEKVERLVQQLAGDVPLGASLDSPPGQRRLLADLLNWHWREQKSGWWEHFSARDVPASERSEHRLVLAALQFDAVVEQVKQSQILRYRFEPTQEHAIRRIPGGTDADTGKDIQLVEVGASHILLKRGIRSKEPHPTALIPSTPLKTQAQQARLQAFADFVVREGLPETAESPSSGEFGSAVALLQRRCPGDGRTALLQQGEDSVAAVSRLVQDLDGRVLAVQGPPGSGKTYRAAQAIVALLRAGRRVGVTANSHSVIADLLTKAVREAQQAGVTVNAHQMADEDPADTAADAEREAPLFTKGKDYAAIVEGLSTGSLNLVGGTSFALCRPEFDSAVDVLFIDEAGQMSLANALAIAPCAKGLVLLGDPAQLEQPQKGIHPLGADASALGHWLGSSITMPVERGLFLEETRRMHPAICEFVSQTFYEGRLQPRAGLEQQRVIASEPFTGSGLRYVPVAHSGNTSSSSEEVERVAQIIDDLLGPGTRVVDAEGHERSLGPADILVITPYNAQVAALKARLPNELKIGTVDKFQGQEAAVVLYSMTTSTSDDAPRGLEFLYSLNRLNVAISRARALAILVASPELFQARCRTPKQMRLVNALCAFGQRATRIDGPR